MNLAEMQKKLIAVARANPPSDRVPLGFEKRIMALLAQRPVDYAAVWASALWRGAIGCIVIVLVVGALSVFVSHQNGPTRSLEQEFENTLLVTANQESDTSAW